MQSYLDLTVEESKLVITWRLRMAKFGLNYGEQDKLCPLCSKHLDSQEASFTKCEKIREAITINCKYNEIFTIPSRTLLGARIFILLLLQVLKTKQTYNL